MIILNLIFILVKPELHSFLKKYVTIYSVKKTLIVSVIRAIGQKKLSKKLNTLEIVTISFISFLFIVHVPTTCLRNE